MSRWLCLAAAVVAFDQWVKARIVDVFAHGDDRQLLPFLSLVRWHNEGAAFAMLGDAGGWQRWFFIVIAVSFVVFIVWELRRLPAGDRLMGTVYGLILGGAVGNLIDRVLLGHVVDFVLLHWRSWYFPAFNVADVALTAGALLWITAMIRDARRARRVEESP